jgi:cobalt-zinc-cadmium efflux system membrane fusion protein
MRVLYLYPIVAVIMLLSTGCGGQSKVDAKAPDTKIEPAPDANLVTVPHPEQFPLAPVELRKTSDRLSANGVVTPDVSRTVPVNAMTGGRVVEVKVRLGDDVQKGQVLLTMNSPDMSSAISDYHKFQTDAALARTQLERAQLLYSHGAVPQKDLQTAESAEQKAKVDLQTAAQRIELLGGDLKQPSALVEVKAPVSGTIIEQNTTTSAGVKSLDNSPNLFTIADLSHVWVLCDVYENNLSQVHLHDRASVQLNAFPDRQIAGRVSNISKLLDPATRTAKVRIDLANERGLLRPNMFATVQFVSEGQHSRLTAPVGAILRLQDRDWVFVKVDGKQFRRTEVQAGPASADGFQEILSGVRAGDQLAADALQFSRAVENAKEQSEQ